MPLRRFASIAFRGVVRNRRRSALTALAVALGLTIVMMMSSVIDGFVGNVLDDNIRVMTGHLQIRNESYESGQGSLLSRDLLQDGQELAVEVEAMAGVQTAAPILSSGGLLVTPQESVGVEIFGIEPDDAFHEPIRTGIVAGEYLQGDDRGRILIGRILADEMGITVGQRISLASSNANGEAQEGIFTVAGLYDTGYPSFDQHRVVLPLAQAQAFSAVGARASNLIVMLNDREEAPAVAARFQDPETQALTWRDLNSLILDSLESGLVFYYILYVIVFLMVAVLIANTLLMSVFERTREIGILASIGMNRRQIMVLFLLEAIILAFFGIAVGLVLGLGAVAYLTFVGISIPAETASMVEGFAFGTNLKGGMALDQFVILTLLLLAVVGLVSLYPAWFAAKLEPVDALHTF